MSQAKIALPPPPAGCAGLGLIYSADGVHVELAYVDSAGVPVGHSALSIRNEGSVENPQLYAQRLPEPGPNFQRDADGRLYMGGT